MDKTKGAMLLSLIKRVNYVSRYARCVLCARKCRNTQDKVKQREALTTLVCVEVLTPLSSAGAPHDYATADAYTEHHISCSVLPEKLLAFWIYEGNLY